MSTKKGDGGFTGLPAAAVDKEKDKNRNKDSTGPRVRKDDSRIECLGALDELDAFLVLCESVLHNDSTAAILAEVRKDLFDAVMPAVAVSSAGTTGDVPVMPDLKRLEGRMAKLKQKPAAGFVRTWTQPAAVHLNLARTVCRRAERCMVTLSGSAEDMALFLPWMNRLSDLLFLLAVSEEQGP